MVKHIADRAIVELIESKDFKQCIAKIEPAHLQKDLASEVYLALLETEPEKIAGMHERGELKYYAVRIILNMACSNTSPFYKTFKKFGGVTAEYKEDEPEKQSIEPAEAVGAKERKKLELLALSLIGQLYWYDAEILKLYLHYGDYRTVSRETRIPFTSIYCTAKKAINELRELIKKAELPRDNEVNGLICKLQSFLKVESEVA